MIKPKGNHAFLKKVYDKYNNSDYTFGDDNLNPKRELSLSEGFEEEKILKRVRERINDIEDTLRDIPVREPEPKVKFPFNDYPTFVPKTAMPKIVIPGVTSYPASQFPSITPLEEQITNLLKKAELSGPFDDDRDSLEEMLKVDCNGLTYNDLIEGVGNNGGNSGISSATTTQADRTKKSNSNPNADEATPTDNSNNPTPTDPEQALLECAKLDLWWLKIILIILKILKILMMVVSLVFAIVIPIIKMIRDTCVCWVDPPALSVAISMNAEIIISIVFTVISIVLTIIFALLKFDCITDVAQEILDAIREVFTGVCGGIEMGAKLVKQGKEAHNEGKLTAKFLEDKKRNKQQQDAKKASMKISADALQEMINIGVDATNDILDSFGVNPTVLAEQGIKDLDEMTTKQSELLKSLGVDSQLSPSNLMTNAYNAVKQVIKIQDRAEGADAFSFNFDTSALSKTKKKIMDSWERFKALCKSPYDKAAEKVKQALNT